MGLEPILFRLKVGGFIQLSYRIFKFATLVALVTFHNECFLIPDHSFNLKLKLSLFTDHFLRGLIRKTSFCDP